MSLGTNPPGWGPLGCKELSVTRAFEAEVWAGRLLISLEACHLRADL